MTTERLSPALRAHLIANATERAHALRSAAVNAWLDALAHGIRRAAHAAAVRARGLGRSARAPRQLEA